MSVIYKGRTLLSWEDDATEFTVEESFRALWKRSSSEIFVVEVPAGFKTDLASIPRIFTWLIPKLGHHLRPAIVHDYCSKGLTTLTKKESSDMFLEGMVTTKVSWWKRTVMWSAVRVWDRKRSES